MALCIAFSYNAALAWPGLMQSGKDAHLQRIQAAFDVQAHLQPGQSLAASWAGALYYFSDARGIDLLGKADPVVARAEADPWLGGTGHNKMDLDYSLGHRHPDWVLLLPPGTPHSGRFDQALAEHSLFRQQCRPEALLPDRAWKLYRCHW